MVINLIEHLSINLDKVQLFKFREKIEKQFIILCAHKIISEEKISVQLGRLGVFLSKNHSQHSKYVFKFVFCIIGNLRSKPVRTKNYQCNQIN